MIKFLLITVLMITFLIITVLMITFINNYSINDYIYK